MRSLTLRPSADFILGVVDAGAVDDVDVDDVDVDDVAVAVPDLDDPDPDPDPEPSPLLEARGGVAEREDGLGMQPVEAYLFILWCFGTDGIGGRVFVFSLEVLEALVLVLLVSDDVAAVEVDIVDSDLISFAVAFTFTFAVAVAFAVVVAAVVSVDGASSFGS